MATMGWATTSAMVREAGTADSRPVAMTHTATKPVEIRRPWPTVESLAALPDLGQVGGWPPCDPVAS